MCAPQQQAPSARQPLGGMLTCSSSAPSGVPEGRQMLQKEGCAPEGTLHPFLQRLSLASLKSIKEAEALSAVPGRGGCANTLRCCYVSYL